MQLWWNYDISIALHEMIDIPFSFEMGAYENCNYMPSYHSCFCPSPPPNKNANYSMPSSISRIEEANTFELKGCMRYCAYYNHGRNHML
jgi:hypothetical protein